jgi:hypothetical protein
MEGSITKFIFYVQKGGWNFKIFFKHDRKIPPVFLKKLLSSLYFLAKIVLQWLSTRPKHVVMLYNKNNLVHQRIFILDCIATVFDLEITRHFIHAAWNTGTVFSFWWRTVTLTVTREWLKLGTSQLQNIVTVHQEGSARYRASLSP